MLINALAAPEGLRRPYSFPVSHFKFLTYQPLPFQKNHSQKFLALNRIRLYLTVIPSLSKQPYSFIFMKSAQPIQLNSVVDQIRYAIIAGEFPAGSALKQDVLAERYQVSKIPVREALNQLMAEGLVMFVKNRGAMVTALSADEVEEIYAMRMALETLALERSISQFSARDRITAETPLKLLELSTDPVEWWHLNWEFHASLYRPANMPRLLETVLVLHNNVARYLLLYLQQLNYQDVSQQEHWDLLELVCNGEVQAATSLLNEHMQSALHNTLQFINSRSE